MKMSQKTRSKVYQIAQSLSDLSDTERLTVALSLLGFELSKQGAPDTDATLRVLRTLVEDYKEEWSTSHDPLCTIGRPWARSLFPNHQ